MPSLREWAIKNKVWEPRNWKVFLEELASFYKIAWQLKRLYDFLKNDEITGKQSLADIKDEELRNKIKVAIYGGVEQNLENSFAKFMFEHFGVRAENANTFKESIELYKRWGEGIKVSIKEESWIGSIPIGKLVDKLKDLIQKLSEKLEVDPSTIEIQDYYPHEVRDLLPNPGEEPRKLISLINKFKQKAVDLAIGKNPFTTFTYYIRTIPLPVLRSFLNRDIYDATKLVNFLELKALSTIDCTEISLPTNSPEKVIIATKWDSIAEKIIELQSFLEGIEVVAKEIFNKMTEEAISQLKFSFEPWKDYKPIFSFFFRILGDNEILEIGRLEVELEVNNGRIIKLLHPVYEYRHYEMLTKGLWLSDFLMRLYPAISVGIIEKVSCIKKESVWINIEFSPFARKWVRKVMENRGKT